MADFVSVSEFDRVLQHLTDVTVKIGSIEQRAVNIETTLTKLDKVFVTGNGQLGMLQQFAQLRTEMNRLQKDLTDYAVSFTAFVKASADERRWRVQMAIPMICSLLASTVAVLIAVFRR